jgi:hypothetical protein
VSETRTTNQYPHNLRSKKIAKATSGFFFLGNWARDQNQLEDLTK